jgi:hypothetical protein
LCVILASYFQGMRVLGNAKLAFDPVHPYNPAHRNATLAASNCAEGAGFARTQRMSGNAHGLFHLGGLASSPKIVVADFLNKCQGAFE